MIFKVVPLRYEHGWRLCDTHKAERWAVALFRRGQRMQVLVKCETKARAESHLVACQRAYEKLAGYRLGQRMGKKETQNVS